MDHFLIEITLVTQDTFLYPCITDIPLEYYELITELKCKDKELQELIYLPNLEVLDCSSNFIPKIPLYPKLKTLITINCNLTEIGDYPLLTHIYAQNNKIKKIGNCPNLKYLNCKRNLLTEMNEYPMLEYLNCSMNSLQHLSFYPKLITLECCCNHIKSIPPYPNLVTLHCSYNEITEIITYPLIVNLICNVNTITRIDNQPNIVRMDCSFNKLTMLPNIITWETLQNFDYRENEIEYIPPNIARFINRMKNKNKFMTVYSDSQNVHNHNIQESIRNSINNIISIKPTIGIDMVFNEIVNNPFLSEECKKIIIEFSNDTDTHSVLNITYGELIHSVWCVIREHHDFKNICEIINMEMIDSVCKCFTGRISRLINCLNGFDSRVAIQMADNDQISNVILIIKRNLEEYNQYTVEKHRHLVQQELLERGFEQDVISVWIENIE